MRPITITMLAVLAMLTNPVLAQGKGKAKAMERDVDQMAESAETRMEQARDNMSGKRPNDDKLKRRAKDSDSDDDSSDDFGDDSSDSRSRDDDSSDDDSSDDRSGNGPRGDNKANRGNATSQEMLDRRDERKAIMEESRANRDPGEERVSPSEDEEAAKKPKKSWWKFWED